MVARMDKRKMSILPVVTAAGYSRTYDWLWIGIATLFLCTKDQIEIFGSLESNTGILVKLLR